MGNLFEIEAGSGEHTEVLWRGPGLRVERIAGAVTEPQRYEQAEDEWVALLRGRALLELAGEARALVAGDWLLIPAGTPHALIESTADALWLAVHAPV